MIVAENIKKCEQNKGAVEFPKHTKYNTIEKKS